MNRIILITGATGLIGKRLTEVLNAEGDQVIAVSSHVQRAKKEFINSKKVIGYDELDSLAEQKIDAFVHLAGVNLSANRWNESFKQKIFDSRVKTANELVRLIALMEQKPEVIITSSGVDYYGDTGSKDIYEDAPSADTFMAQVCVEWESAAEKASYYGVRTVIMRTGVVFAKDSTAIKKLVLPFKLFSGGMIGSGKQYLSWIHIDDLINIYLLALGNKSIIGPVNAVSPHPVTMKELSKMIGKVLHRPSFFKVPAFAVKIAAGEMAQVVLAGRKALPGKMTEMGFEFVYPNVEDALKNVLE